MVHKLRGGDFATVCTDNRMRNHAADAAAPTAAPFCRRVVVKYEKYMWTAVAACERVLHKFFAVRKRTVIRARIGLDSQVFFILVVELLISLACVFAIIVISNS